MKNFLLFATALISWFTGLAQQTTLPLPVKDNLPDDKWLSNARQYLKESECHFKKQAGVRNSFYAWNSKQGIGFIVSKEGFSISPVLFSSTKTVSNKWEAGVDFLSIARGDQRMKGEAACSIDEKDAELNFNFPGFSIQYINEPNGIRQNFIVSKKLSGKKDLEIVLNIRGNLSAAVSDNRLCLHDSKGINKLFYQDLQVWDAHHKKLEASMQLKDENTLAIVVKDQDATYPIIIDPINQTPEWETSANGALPTLLGQAAIDAAYGFNVAGLGDVNADGFDDVAVGAPAMVDLISGTGTLASVGAVFVYYGSVNGLPTTPSAKLQPATAIAGALFGYSVAGGDINNDGKADILVGAPLDNVSVSIGGGNTAQGTIGKAYVFSGATLSTTSTPLLTLQLSGTGILENGINLSVNALFGFSVAVTEDLNADGKKDMIVGAPAYAGIKNGLLGAHLLDVQSGGAFLFLTNANNNNLALTKLDPIKSGILGLGILNSNINGLLFGYSVDGLGDYNGDGKPDVVVSAPAGVDASSITGLLSGKIFQGSASVFYGNGNGVNTNPGATLSATSGGLIDDLSGSIGNVANLFGLKVRSATNADGTRNGNVLVGAPLGGAVTNITGLQLKTGTVNIFLKKVVSPTGYVAPDQVLSSPRNNNNILSLIQSNLLFGYSLDNVMDVNCDGVNDIIIGEPVSSAAQLLNANIAGGAAYIYLGKSDGTYQAAPAWTLTAYEDAFLGVNATSLIGFSVAGAGNIRGTGSSSRILIGNPSRTLDFGAGLLHLGNTVGTLFSLAVGNNGIGKAYLFDTRLCPGVVDVALTGFKGRYTNGISYLTWETLQETNYKQFEIEKSNDGQRFIPLSIIPAKGNSGTKTNYHFNDHNVTKANNYYRIRLVDKEGNVVYSPVILLNAGDRIDNIVSISPNPFNDRVTLSVNAAINQLINIKILDNTGKTVINQVQKVHTGNNKLTVDNLSYLPGGIYVAEINLDGRIISQKILK